MKKLILLVALAAVAVAGWRWHGHASRTAESADADGKLFRDRIWIDHMPRGERDMVNVLVVISEQPIGAFQTASMWKGSYEAFRYELNGNELRAMYPQTGDRERVKVRVRECSEHGMDYCLEVDGSSRGVKRYYSREEWVIDSLDSARAKVDELERAAGSSER